MSFPVNNPFSKKLQYPSRPTIIWSNMRKSMVRAASRRERVNCLSSGEGSGSPLG